MTNKTTKQLKREFQDKLKGLTNEQLAITLELALDPTPATQDLAGNTFWDIRREADNRAGHIARAKHDAEFEQFHAKHGIRAEMTEFELVKIYDHIDESEFPRGYARILIEVLRTM